MVEESKIRPHMEVRSADGAHYGTVDGLAGDRIKLTRMTMKLSIPGSYPIFKEMPISLGRFTFTISNRLLGHRLLLGYQIRSPGCSKESHGHIELGESGQMFLRMPPN